MVTLHFTSSLLPGAALIRGVTSTTWHHCAIEVDGFVYEAKFPKGVICRRVEEFRSANKRIKSFSIHCKDKEGLKEFLEKVLGQGYDLAAAFGIFLHSDFDIEHLWHCAELLADAVRNYCDIDLPKISARCKPEDILFAAWPLRIKT